MVHSLQSGALKKANLIVEDQWTHLIPWWNTSLPWFSLWSSDDLEETDRSEHKHANLRMAPMKKLLGTSWGAFITYSRRGDADWPAVYWREKRLKSSHPSCQVQTPANPMRCRMSNPTARHLYSPGTHAGEERPRAHGSHDQTHSDVLFTPCLKEEQLSPNQGQHPRHPAKRNPDRCRKEGTYPGVHWPGLPPGLMMLDSWLYSWLCGRNNPQCSWRDSREAEEWSRDSPCDSHRKILHKIQSGSRSLESGSHNADWAERSYTVIFFDVLSALQALHNPHNKELSDLASAMSALQNFIKITSGFLPIATFQEKQEEPLWNKNRRRYSYNSILTTTAVTVSIDSPEKSKWSWYAWGLATAKSGTTCSPSSTLETLTSAHSVRPRWQ